MESKDTTSIGIIPNAGRIFLHFVTDTKRVIGGKASNAHSLDEWWINENGHQMIQLVLLIALSQAGGV
ncbi:MAG: hypothetical protein O2831_06270 [Bacteroidetes bacterium]|nr:hypothetical protein [Bacteroidota bacterium]